MIRIAELKLPLEAANAPDAALRAAAAQALGIAEGEIGQLAVFKRSFDARKASIAAVYIVDVSLRAGEAAECELLARHARNPHIRATPDMRWHPPAQAPQGLAERPVVVGFGPCGMFAALCLAQMGFRPIVLERGKPVRERTQDTWALWRKRKLSPQSNVQFGEGGAGTFSDGKLYSQIKDPRFLGRKVIDEFVKAGAPEDIRYAAHPHIGTFKLVKVVEHIRAQIVALGGELRFHSQVVGLLRDSEGLRGLRVRDLASGADSECPTRHAVLALGHSARDSFAMLHDAGLEMQAKPFSVGVRIEHPQSVIDRARWGRHAGHPLLGAADYKLVHHAANGRAVYSFCMCPGGTV
ncbi:MAG TPA: FAD-dependent oxidoreductase, partial [Burkholderiaceae bacterium]|nr:FAD-dependent oxidoreductase [Burkholderiaceae bacterium]